LLMKCRVSSASASETLCLANCNFASCRAMSQCYIRSLYSVHFKGALNSGEAQGHRAIQAWYPNPKKHQILAQFKFTMDKSDEITGDEGQRDEAVCQQLEDGAEHERSALNATRLPTGGRAKFLRTTTLHSPTAVSFPLQENASAAAKLPPLFVWPRTCRGELLASYHLPFVRRSQFKHAQYRLTQSSVSSSR